MNSRRVAEIAQWTIAFGALAGIVLVYRRWLHVNPTTVALSMLLLILVLAARLPLRYPVILSVAAAACYNFFFLPPFLTFTINDPQNWLALFAFLATGVIGSRLSERAKAEAEEARQRQREIALLFHLSREVLQIESVLAVINTLPGILRDAVRAERALLYLMDGDRVYDADLQTRPMPEIAWLREQALSLRRPEMGELNEVSLPLQAGARPRGLLVMWGVGLSRETLQAIGGLVSIALDRAQALESAARSEASKESERLRTLILDSITHELRTPLTSIKGAASTMLANGKLDAQAREELLTIIDEEADRLNHLIGQAVEMAQIESGEVHMNLGSVAVTELLEEARAACEQVWARHPMTMPEDGPQHVFADAEMIVKLLCNLIENAGKYSPPGSLITISVESEESRVAISVADRGVGIEPAEQDLIFDRLYRAPSQSGITSGTGMGLAISRAIADAHGGRLEVTSQPGVGSVFTLWLPKAMDTKQPRTRLHTSNLAG